MTARKTKTAQPSATESRVWVWVETDGPGGSSAYLCHPHATPAGASQCARHLRSILGAGWKVTTRPNLKRVEPVDRRRRAKTGGAR